MKQEEAIERMVMLRQQYEGALLTTQAIDIAIEALLREIPKNPVINYVTDSDGARRLDDAWAEDSLLCPVCHTYFGEVFDEGYCRKCGQKLIQKRIKVIEE